MSYWLLFIVCIVNLATGIGGSLAIKHAVETDRVIWALIGAACWIGTATCMAVLLQARPMIWVALATNSLTLLGTVACAVLLFGERVEPIQIVALGLALAALACTALSGH